MAVFRVHGRSSGQSLPCLSGRLSGYAPHRTAIGSGERMEAVPIGSGKIALGQGAPRLALFGEGQTTVALMRATGELRLARSQNRRTKTAWVSLVSPVKTAVHLGPVFLESGQRMAIGPSFAEGKAFAKMASPTGEGGRRNAMGSEALQVVQALRSESPAHAPEVMPMPHETRGPPRCGEGRGQTLA